MFQPPYFFKLRNYWYLLGIIDICLLKFSFSTNQGLDDAVPVLLVDGYNVCGYWPKLKKHFMGGRLDIARQKLIDELITFCMVKGPVSFVTCISRLLTWHDTVAFRIELKKKLPSKPYLICPLLYASLYCHLCDYSIMHKH